MQHNYYMFQCNGTIDGRIDLKIVLTDFVNNSRLHTRTCGRNYLYLNTQQPISHRDVIKLNLRFKNEFYLNRCAIHTRVYSKACGTRAIFK